MTQKFGLPGASKPGAAWCLANRRQKLTCSPPSQVFMKSNKHAGGKDRSRSVTTSPNSNGSRRSPLFGVQMSWSVMPSTHITMVWFQRGRFQDTVQRPESSPLVEDERLCSLWWLLGFAGPQDHSRTTDWGLVKLLKHHETPSWLVQRFLRPLLPTNL